jgi:hypothetical protein
MHHKPLSLDVVSGWAEATTLGIGPGYGVTVAVVERVWRQTTGQDNCSDDGESGLSSGIDKRLLKRQVLPCKENYQTLVEMNEEAFNYARDSAHGLNSLTVLEAAQCQGIVPYANVRAVSSLWHDAEGRWVTNIANAILNAALHLSPGDVLLLEQQSKDLVKLVENGQETSAHKQVPVESDPAVWQAIRIATELGIIVIEPAGNSGIQITRTDGSGAIIVGCCEPGKERRRRESTNWGEGVVDCYAWGRIVIKKEVYADTSAASAQIAGVAALIQSIYKAKNPGKCLLPAQMRALLKCEGIPAPGQHIGVMPNIPAIIARITARNIWC